MIRLDFNNGKYTGESLPQGVSITACEKGLNIKILPGYEVGLVEIFSESGDIRTNIILEADSKLNHYRIEASDVKTENRVTVLKNALYNNINVQYGDIRSHNETIVNLMEENASAQVDIAYSLKGKGELYNNTLVNHLHPYTYSNQLIKAVVFDSAKGNFDGKIHIAKNAVKTNGYMLHKALLLSDGAEVGCKPELEIFADDVKCSHGTATGVLDEMQLFYMTSRGISVGEAKQMLIDAYLDDVLNKISNNKIYEWVKDRI